MVRPALGFGGGVHRCYGNHMARKEIAVLIDEFLKRIPEFEIAPGFTPTIEQEHQENLAALPLTWKLPAHRNGEGGWPA